VRLAALILATLMPILPQAFAGGPPKVPPARRSAAKSPGKQNGRLAQALAKGKKRGKKQQPNFGNRKNKKLKPPRRK
jgi:hypothetical protein